MSDFQILDIEKSLEVKDYIYKDPQGYWVVDDEQVKNLLVIETDALDFWRAYPDYFQFNDKQGGFLPLKNKSQTLFNYQMDCVIRKDHDKAMASLQIYPKAIIEGKAHGMMIGDYVDAQVWNVLYRDRNYHQQMDSIMNGEKIETNGASKRLIV